ncbi:MAG: 23S rRNA (uracil(1939)-C(5))-methyltransferase RlmD [Bacteroidetes bacterium]|nr:23S rRNA (uracil(1939)-C(5))-methyltransferase RlmD [Bacteroidota bacterium]
MSRKPQKKHYIVEAVPIVDCTHEGKGVGRKDEFVVFVEKTVPGDLVDVRVTGKEKKVPVGVVERMIKPSEDRVAATCQHFGDCGGCKWQNLSYEKQLFYKERQVTEALRRIGHLQVGEARPILGCLSPFNYRNKVEFTFSNKQWVPAEQMQKGEPIEWNGALGYHVARFFDKIIPIETCHLHLPAIDAIRNEIRDFTRARKDTWYDIKAHTGYYRNVLFRTSEGTGELMVLVLVAEDDIEPVNALFEHLSAKFPEITSLLWIFNPKMNDSFSDLEPRIWKGNASIIEHLGPWKYRISPTSFFQTNTTQAKRLYDVVRDFVGEKTGIIYDLYCGAGSIGIFINDLADKVVGVEYVDSAVKDAYENCKLNGLNHLSFYSGNLKDILKPEFVAREGRPDVIVTDPPRAGMDEPVVQQLLEIAAPRIVYVSCNPATQARDLQLLSAKYDVLISQPVDMFPQTSHVENVVLLELRSEN